jgi:hypothetical protein
MSATGAQTENERRFDAMLAAASKACDERLSAILQKNIGLPEPLATEAFGKECEKMMREGLPPLDTPNTTEDGMPRAITISLWAWDGRG